MVLSRDGIPVSSYEPDFVDKKIVIAIDSSKSNTAMVIGDPNGNVYHDYEIDGSGSDNDVYLVAYETRKAMRTLLKGADIVFVGIEDIITKKSDNEKYGKGMQVHQSRAKITHIFDSFIIFFMDEFGITPEPENNQAWKAAILPEEFRKRVHHKGSKDYYDTYFPGSRWANRKDDVTDAYCIYQFILKRHKFEVKYTISDAVLYKGEFDWGFFPISTITKLPSTVRRFDYNEALSIEQTANALASAMTTVDKYVYVILPIDKLDVKDIYGDRMHNIFDKNTTELALVVSK